MTDGKILDDAKALVTGDRNDDYGPAWEDYGRTAKLWSIILNHEVTASHAALCMVAVKLSRECHKHKRDNLVDMAGYAAVVQAIEDHNNPQIKPLDGESYLTYLASPYSSPDESVRVYRYKEACKAVTDFVNKGRAVYSPIVNSHALTGDIPGDWKFWEIIDRQLLQKCDEICVLCLPGWDSSVGVTAELAFAKEIGKRITYRLIS